jgi:hypothetical protein
MLQELIAARIDELSAQVCNVIAMIISLILSLFVLTHAPFAEAAKRLNCEGALKSRTSVDVTGDFDPREAMRRARLDPSKLRIVIDHKPHGPDNDEASSIDVTFYNEDEEVGGLQLQEHDPGVWATYSGLEEPYRGRGIGAILYLVGTEIVFELYPKAKKLISFDGSGDANYMWEKLVRSGRATKKRQDPNEDPVRWIYAIERRHINPALKFYVKERLDFKDYDISTSTRITQYNPSKIKQRIENYAGKDKLAQFLAVFGEDFDLQIVKRGLMIKPGDFDSINSENEGWLGPIRGWRFPRAVTKKFDDQEAVDNLLLDGESHFGVLVERSEPACTKNQISIHESLRFDDFIFAHKIGSFNLEKIAEGRTTSNSIDWFTPEQFVKKFIPTKCLAIFGQRCP